ncbi:glycosyltransferase [Billgrantia azerbaijanica]|nr:glycosyltransferase [Halomonas azerbaijanica]
MPHIIAVILTYNRRDLLKRCLTAVYSQTRPCDAVIVVDNASCDGTSEFLSTASYPRLQAYELSENIGAAGGFNAGFRLAHQQGADLVWMMDDDVLPEPDALERLLAADTLLADKGIERSFLISSAHTESGYVTNTPVPSRVKNRIGYGDWPVLLDHRLAAVEKAGFISILVPRNVLERHGLPIASMFIWGEDTEFTLRISRQAPGFLVGDSRVLHLRQEGGPIRITSERNPMRMRYHRNLIRNNLFIARKYQPWRRLPPTLFSLVRLSCRLLRTRQFGKAVVVFQGALSSLCFSPGVERVDASIDSLGVEVHRLLP